MVPRHPGLDWEVCGVGLAHLLVVQLLKPVGILRVVLDGFARDSAKQQKRWQGFES